MSLVGAGQERVLAMKTTSADLFNAAVEGDMKPLFTPDAWSKLTPKSQKFFQDKGFRDGEVLCSFKRLTAGKSLQLGAGAMIPYGLVVAGLWPQNIVWYATAAARTNEAPELVPIKQDPVSKVVFQILLAVDRAATHGAARIAILDCFQSILLDCSQALSEALGVAGLPTCGSTCFTSGGGPGGPWLPDFGGKQRIPAPIEPFEKPRIFCLSRVSFSALRDFISNYNASIIAKRKLEKLQKEREQTFEEEERLRPSRQAEEIAKEIDQTSRRLRKLLNSVPIPACWCSVKGCPCRSLQKRMRDVLWKLKIIAVQAKTDERVPVDEIARLHSEFTGAPGLLKGGRWGISHPDRPGTSVQTAITRFNEVISTFYHLQRLYDRRRDILATEFTVIPEQISRFAAQIAAQQAEIEKRQQAFASLAEQLTTLAGGGTAGETFQFAQETLAGVEERSKQQEAREALKRELLKMRDWVSTRAADQDDPEIKEKMQRLGTLLFRMADALDKNLDPVMALGEAVGEFSQIRGFFDRKLQEEQQQLSELQQRPLANIRPIFDTRQRIGILQDVQRSLKRLLELLGQSAQGVRDYQALVAGINRAVADLRAGSTPNRELISQLDQFTQLFGVLSEQVRANKEIQTEQISELKRLVGEIKANPTSNNAQAEQLEEKINSLAQAIEQLAKRPPEAPPEAAELRRLVPVAAGALGLMLLFGR